MICLPGSDFSDHSKFVLRLLSWTVSRHGICPMKRVLIVFAAVAAVIVSEAVFVVDSIPPRALTATRMQVLKRRVLQYARAHGELPRSLVDLPAVEGYDGSIRDGWSRTILFEVSSNLVTFRSLGRDGIPGGSGDDMDMVRSFPARDAQGQWCDEMIGWSEDTFRK